MLGKLTGTVDTLLSDRIILDVNGVGYVVFVTQSALSSLSQHEGAVSLWIETHVREDHIHLFGFLAQEEQEWFLTLTAVNGVGPKMGLAILSAMPPAQLSLALAAQDKAQFIQISGVGPKLAARLVTELKDKAGTVFDIETAQKAPAQGSNVEPIANAAMGNKTMITDAVSALVNLGYGRSEVLATVSQFAAENEDSATVESMIKHGLQQLGGR